MCNSFRPDEDMKVKLAPFGTRDSCDEYPLFASYENTAHPDSSISDGSECAQLTAVQAPNPVNDLPADWKEVAEPGSPTGSELCVRPRIPAKLRFSV
ncbi:hypothetical protein CU254_19255 [Amycolatopsis sp. AA4]|nr:hypothetical protein CU254_19255 [Amycolatopsis sp. AA4]